MCLFFGSSSFFPLKTQHLGCLALFLTYISTFYYWYWNCCCHFLTKAWNTMVGSKLLKGVKLLVSCVINCSRELQPTAFLLSVSCSCGNTAFSIFSDLKLLQRWILGRITNINQHLLCQLVHCVVTNAYCIFKGLWKGGNQLFINISDVILRESNNSDVSHCAMLF